MKHSVFVGLSGGVDSAVSAALLHEQGYDVTGVFIKIWSPEFIECTWQEDRLDAMRVCAGLNIPFREIDLSEQYKKDVVDAMVGAYERGVTPNPDVLCNRSIKFGAFAAWAKSEGAQSIATGHYAQNKNEMGHYALTRAHDAAKDQSYFLYTLTQADLRHIVFPIGGMRKSQVRKEASRFGLPHADKPDSQGLCFVGEVTMEDFLARYIELKPGRVVDKHGTVIGQHHGAALYTLGQRHGFTTKAGGGPYYVVGVDVRSNIVRVSKNRDDAARTSITIDNVAWTLREPQGVHTYAVQARYHEEPVQAKLSKQGQRWSVVFDKPHIASPGQSLVVYDGDICVGGGVIAQSPHIGR